jgi:outer membrane protein assembly factor BamB
MRHFPAIGFIILVGCTTGTPPVTAFPRGRGVARPTDAADLTSAPDPEPSVKSGPDAPLPSDLGTRKAGSDWPRFLGPTGDSVSAEKGVVAPWPKEGPRLVWEKKVGTGYAMPTISRGRLFLFDRTRNRARLTCLKSETGEELWAFDYRTDYVDSYGYNNGPRCSPVVDGERVYLYGPEGMLHCVRATDGKLVWKLDTAAEFGVIQNFFGVGSTPVVEGDLLLVQVGGSPKGSEDVDFARLKGNGSGLVTFDKYTGEVKYKTTDELASYASPVLATIDKKRWCFLFARGGLVGLDPANGKVEFRYPWRAKTLESVNASNPVVVGDKVFISETYGPGSALLKVKPGACEEVWTDAKNGRDDKSMQCHWNTPIHVDGYLYGCSGRHDNNAELRCIELATGKVMWSVPNLQRTSLLLVDGHFVCLAEDGVLSLLKVNSNKYEEVSSVIPQSQDDPPRPLLQKPCWAAPIQSHGLLYVRGHDRLACLELIPPKKE